MPEGTPSVNKRCPDTLAPPETTWGEATTRQSGRTATARPHSSNPASPRKISCPPPTRAMITAHPSSRSITSKSSAASERPTPSPLLLRLPFPPLLCTLGLVEDDDVLVWQSRGMLAVIAQELVDVLDEGRDFMGAVLAPTPGTLLAQHQSLSHDLDQGAVAGQEDSRW